MVGAVLPDLGPLGMRKLSRRDQPRRSGCSISLIARPRNNRNRTAAQDTKVAFQARREQLVLLIKSCPEPRTQDTQGEPSL